MEEKQLVKKEAHRVYIAEWRQKNPGSQKNYYLKKHYGVTLAEATALLETQENQCFSCEQEFTGPRKAYPYFDTELGKVTGMVCLKCRRKLDKAPAETPAIP